jgi:hypothetical protein
MKATANYIAREGAKLSFDTVLSPEVLAPGPHARRMLESSVSKVAFEASFAPDHPHFIPCPNS